jgi:hypothetical protein
MTKSKLHTDNPELLHYIAEKLHITILGGIKFTGLDRLKVTLKIVNRDNAQKVFRHNVDLYNSIQTGQLVERAADYLDIPTATVNETIDHLTTALEEYRAAHLESLKPKPQEVKQLTEAERKAELFFLKAPDFIKQTAEAITMFNSNLIISLGIYIKMTEM